HGGQGARQHGRRVRRVRRRDEEHRQVADQAHADEQRQVGGPDGESSREDRAGTEGGGRFEGGCGKGRARCWHSRIVADARLPAQGQGSWYTMAPPTTVSAGFAWRTCSGTTVSRSRSQTTRSASLPRSSVPFTSSWNSAYALPAV